MDGKEKEEKVYKVFQKIADNYDKANKRISLGNEQKWKNNLVKLFDEFEYAIDDEDEQGRIINILDVCCGTGDLAISIKKAHPKYSVHGLDFSPAMLSVAKKKMNAEFPDTLAPAIAWNEGNAMKLPMPDSYFDGVCISFGLRNTPDYEHVLSEMRRVVRPGGIVACLDSFVPQNKFIKFFYDIYFKGIMPILGGFIRHKKEYKWLASSTEDFLKPDELESLFGKIGLSSVHKKSFMFGACYLHWGRK